MHKDTTVASTTSSTISSTTKAAKAAKAAKALARKEAIEQAESQMPLPLLVPFRTGDTVVIREVLLGLPELPEVHIIHKVMLVSANKKPGARHGYSFEYSTDKGAWFDHKDCTLVAAASNESIQQLIEAIRSEEDED